MEQSGTADHVQCGEYRWYHIEYIKYINETTSGHELKVEIVPHPIFCLQGMQLTTNSSTPLMCMLAWVWECWMRKLKSFQLICWTMQYVIWSRFCHSFETEMLIYRFSKSHLLREQNTPQNYHNNCHDASTFCFPRPLNFFERFPKTSHQLKNR